MDVRKAAPVYPSTATYFSNAASVATHTTVYAVLGHHAWPRKAAVCEETLVKPCSHPKHLPSEGYRIAADHVAVDVGQWAHYHDGRTLVPSSPLDTKPSQALPRAGYTLAQASSCHTILIVILDCPRPGGGTYGMGSGRLYKHRAGSRTSLKRTLPADMLIKFHLYRIYSF